MQEKKWYAAYTRPRAEKKVYERLIRQGFETYLPIQHVRRKWSDRYKWVDVPLLPSYIFLKLSSKEYANAIKTEGLVRYVTLTGKPTPIPEAQINNLKILLNEKDADVEIELTKENFKPGTPVVIKYGAFAGIEGEVVEYRGGKRLLLRLDNIGQSVTVTLPVNLIEADNQNK
ncbi:MAG: UpxY family transcription antiterminator [Bacteroidales bacterium]